jgi:glycosyltransferase involved in cell wall biosynthesis
MPPKVCQLCAVDFTAKHFLLPLVDGMKQQGWPVTTVCSDGKFVPGMRADGYHVVTISIARSMNPILALLSLIKLVRFFRREQFHIVHVHTPIAALIGRVAAKIARVPFIVYTAHGFYFHDEMPAWKKRVYVLLERFGGLFTDLLFSQSHEDARDAIALQIMPAGQVVAIGNGVNLTQFPGRTRETQAAARRTLGIPESVPVIGIVARLVQEKGYKEFFEAAVAISSSFPDVYFLVVGERLASDHSGSVELALAQARKVLGVRLIEAGLRKDISAMLSAMTIFCLPSYREGMPRTIIEAMMMELPVVATNIRGVREEVVDGKTGILVPTRNSTALAQALSELLSDPARTSQMGIDGRCRALRLYDESSVIALQIEEIRKRLPKSISGRNFQ